MRVRARAARQQRSAADGFLAVAFMGGEAGMPAREMRVLVGMIGLECSSDVQPSEAAGSRSRRG